MKIHLPHKIYFVRVFIFLLIGFFIGWKVGYREAVRDCNEILKQSVELTDKSVNGFINILTNKRKVSKW